MTKAAFPALLEAMEEQFREQMLRLDDGKPYICRHYLDGRKLPFTLSNGDIPGLLISAETERELEIAIGKMVKFRQACERRVLIDVDGFCKIMNRINGIRAEVCSRLAKFEFRKAMGGWQVAASEGMMN